MPLNIIEKSAGFAEVILLAFEKNQENHEIIKKYSGLSYVPEMNLGPKDVLSIYHPVKEQKISILGLGEQKDHARSYQYFRSAIHQLKSKTKIHIEVIGSHLSDELLTNAVIGLRISLVNIGAFKTNGNRFEEPQISLIIDKSQESIANKALSIAEAQVSAMHLVDTPSNIKTPEYMADYAVASGKKYGYKVDVYDKKALTEMKMDALLAVGQGSCHEPRLIVMEYNPKGKKSTNPKLGLVGKGISFDTGGISIKPSANMGYMKSDMGGAAAVIGAVELAARLKLDIHIVGVVPAAENSVDANSIRPGDVISSYSGKSIEVIDTDAEGRLVLADGLAYIIRNYQPENLIDLATLTGSVIAALGYTASGMFTHNDEMAASLTSVGAPINERVWRMPMWEDYAPDMHSDIADIKNLSSRPVAGSITAAKFLEVFTSEHKNWVHLDIAGVAFADSEFAKSRTATAYGVRLLGAYMESMV
ncbi:MAG TPA: leucyl aminopeptidase family protein [Saprospiraceae bacterium]|nr:leucyl aminopeptidase family protein [Saprospiraceae bacterium]